MCWVCGGCWARGGWRAHGFEVFGSRFLVPGFRFCWTELYRVGARPPLLPLKGLKDKSVSLLVFGPVAFCPRSLAMAGRVPGSLIQELLTVLTLHRAVGDLGKEIANMIEVTEFLQSLHSDNPYISRCLARGCASFHAVLAALEVGQEFFPNEEYDPFNRFNRAEMMMSMGHKLSAKDYGQLCRMEEMITHFLEKWEDHASAHFLPLKGCGDLLWPLVCECNNILPHLRAVLI